MEKPDKDIPEWRLANKAQAAEFCQVNAKTIDSWIRRGAPVVTRGGLGKAWKIDLLRLAEWRFGPGEELAVDPDPGHLIPTDRRAWYESEVRRRQLNDSDQRLVPRRNLETILPRAEALIGEHLEAMRELVESHLTTEDAQVAADTFAELRSALNERLGELATSDGPIDSRDRY